MLGATMLIVGYLWWKLGSSSEYRGPAGEVEFYDQPQMTEAQQAADSSSVKDVQLPASSLVRVQEK